MLRDPHDHDPKREGGIHLPECKVAPPVISTSDIPEEWRDGRYVTLTVGGDVDLPSSHPTEANPEARG